MVLPSSFPAAWILGLRGPEEAKNLAGQKRPQPDSDPFSDVEFGENLAQLSTPKKKSFNH